MHACPTHANARPTRTRRRVRHLLPRSAFLPASPLLLRHASQGLPPSALSLLAACLAPEPAARPGAGELVCRVEELLKVRGKGCGLRRRCCMEVWDCVTWGARSRF